MKTILFPTDFAPQSPFVLDYLRLLARGWQARVVAVHVFQPLIAAGTLPAFNDPALATPSLDPTLSTASADLEAISQQHLDRFVESLQAEGLDVVV
jgi:nucleotide-binding universal stress UspA family protein